MSPRKCQIDLDCPESADACTAAICDPALGCQYSPEPLGTTCDDHIALTIDDVCNAMGQCHGLPAPAWPLGMHNTQGNVVPVQLGVDASGHVYAALRFGGRWVSNGYLADFNIQGERFDQTGQISLAVISFAANGSRRWVRTFGDRWGAVDARTMHVLEDGTSLSAGLLRYAADFGSGFALDGGGRQHPLVVTIDSVGETTAADLYQAGSSNAQVHAVNGRLGRVGIAGIYGNIVDFGAVQLPTATGDDGFAAVLTASGEVQWSRHLPGAGMIFGSQIKLDTTGGAWVSGIFSADVDLGGILPLATAGGYDGFLARYDAQGAFVWQHRWGGVGGDAFVFLHADADERLFGANGFRGEITIDGQTVSQAGAFQEAFLCAWGVDGGVRWIKSWGSSGAGAGNVSVTNIGALVDGTVWVAGAYYGTLDLGSGFVVSSLGGRDAWVAFFAPDSGDPVGLQSLGSPNDLGLWGVVVDEANSTGWMLGTHSGSLTFGDQTVNGAEAFLHPMLMVLP